MRKISFCEKHFCSLFSWALIRTFSLKLFHITDYINFIGLKKCKKEFNMLEIVLVQGFCPLKINITEFFNRFRLKLYSDTLQSWYYQLVHFAKKCALNYGKTYCS